MPDDCSLTGSAGSVVRDFSAGVDDAEVGADMQFGGVMSSDSTELVLVMARASLERAVAAAGGCAAG